MCQIATPDGDLIGAEQIDIDTIKRQLTFVEPAGTLAATKENMPVAFSAGVLLWNDAEGLLTLRDHVDVSQQGLGNLQTANEVHLIQHIVDGHKALRAIETPGDTLLTYRDDTSAHTLKCSGPLKVNHQKMETRLYSTTDAAGSVSEDKQVCFKDAKGEIYADKALIKYEYVNRNVTPTKIVLLGNVKIFNRLPVSNDDTTPVLQYLLAERVEFYPLTKEMIFISKNGGRVLFFDKANNLQVSASTLKIVRDKATKKESVKGLGDVRFSFVEHEFDQLRRRFSLDKVIKPNSKSPK